MRLLKDVLDSWDSSLTAEFDELAGKQAGHVMSELPARHIRLFKLAQPLGHISGELGDEALEGSLIYIPLDGSDTVPYTAVSYCWGAADTAFSLSCGTNKLHITSNLHDLLRHLQRANWPLPLWIDAICIQQDNLVEKATQIPLMGEIFQRARQTFAWIGNAPVDLSPVWGYASQLPQLRHNIMAAYGSQELAQKDGQQPPENFWDVLGDVFRRPYSNRLWVMQEIALSKIVFVLCGDYLIPWPQFYAIAAMLGLSSDIAYRARGPSLRFVDLGLSALQIASLELLRKEEPKSSYMILLSQNRDCTDLRDKVYGLLAILPAPVRLSITPDYSKSVQEVYIEFACAVLCTEEKDAMQCLKFAGISNQKIGSLPSWAIDLTQMTLGQLAWDSRFAAGICNDMPDLRPRIHLQEDRRHLEIHGLESDEVLHIVPHPPNSPQFSTDSTGRATQAWNEECLKLCRKTLNVGAADLPEAYLITLTANKYDRRYTAEDYERWQRSMQDGMQTVLTALASKVCETFRERIFFSTKHGRIGVGPMNTQVGDRVCIPFQSQVPFMMRPTASGRYLLLGDAYCHGLMKGEALEAMRENGTEEVKFVLE